MSISREQVYQFLHGAYLRDIEDLTVKKVYREYYEFQGWDKAPPMPEWFSAYVMEQILAETKSTL